VIIDVEEDDEGVLQHYGILRKSGRYKWGSGETQYHRNRGFLDFYDEMRKAGLSDKEIAKGLYSGPNKSEEVSVAQLRDARTIALNQNKLEDYHQARKLQEKGVSNGEIARIMGKPGESSIRALTGDGVKEKLEKKLATANMLKDEVERKKAIDVGKGVESNLGISAEQLRASVGQLREQGYNLHTVNQPGATSQHETKMKVLTLPHITQKDLFLDKGMIQQIDAVTSDEGRNWVAPKKHEYVSIDPKRLHVKYGDEGGSEADGVIFVRPGVADVNIGQKRYAQVRIKIGDDHFLKGMAMYKEDLPKGVDLLFNTNKTREDAAKEARSRGDKDEKLGALKPLEKENKDYPFGSVVRRQIVDKGKDTEHVKSALNIVNEEGDWEKWGRNISAQALSKQAPTLAKTQLDKTYASHKDTYDTIMSLTNPVVTRKLLESFSDGVDKSAVHLKAAALDRQNWHVILPIASLKPNEIYAPKYNDGESVVLIRYPHGGKFEIPEVRVNNKHPESIRLLGKEPRDAIGIHHSVAERLSGADFDGDTVLVIPNNKKLIKTDPALESLKGFDAKRQYKLPEGRTFKGNLQMEMGKVSNLITDMTLMGAPNNQIAQAVKHSMVVIDAKKHNLDHQRSARDFGIAKLKEEYQGGANAGASTIISRAKSETRLPDRKPRPYKEGGPIDTLTGELRYVPSGKKRKDKAGNLVDKEIKSKKLAEEPDAHNLVSDAKTRVEKIYADHSNRLKSLANQARLSQINQPKMQINPSSKKVFASEVASLDAKLALAKRNAPRERQAQIIASKVIAAERAANPGLDQNSMKKIKFRAQEEARNKMGVETNPIKITKEEWSAIQAGAISESKLKAILDKADLDIVQKHATPRPERIMSVGDANRAMTMLNRGISRRQVAQALGVSLTTLDAYTTGDTSTEDDHDVVHDA
jgi:hypothetical protein